MPWGCFSCSTSCRLVASKDGANSTLNHVANLFAPSPLVWAFLRKSSAFHQWCLDVVSHARLVVDQWPARRKPTLRWTRWPIHLHFFHLGFFSQPCLRKQKNFLNETNTCSNGKSDSPLILTAFVLRKLEYFELRPYVDASATSVSDAIRSSTTSTTSPASSATSEVSLTEFHVMTHPQRREIHWNPLSICFWFSSVLFRFQSLSTLWSLSIRS